MSHPNFAACPRCGSDTIDPWLHRDNPAPDRFVFCYHGTDHKVVAADGSLIAGLEAFAFVRAPARAREWLAANGESKPAQTGALTEAQRRKRQPLATGVLDYFPDALLEVAECSVVGNEQHNPGEPLHWAKEKSTDEADALLRHLKDRGTRDSDGVRHSAKVAWRALANLQREIEAERDREVAP